MSSYLCPGLYCGRLFLNESLNEDDVASYPECGPCPVGYRSSNFYNNKNNLFSACIKCKNPLQVYDWLYLSFNVLIQLLIEFYIIDHCIKRNFLKFETIAFYLSCSIEVGLAAFFTLNVFSSNFASFKIFACKTLSLSDWYSTFYNPILNGKQFKCNNEIIYPLYSIVFLHYFLSLIFMLILRPCVTRRIKNVDSAKIIYLTMYVLPFMALMHFLFSGFIYFFFPYVLFLGSIISIIIHLSYKLNQHPLELIKASFKNSRSLSIIIIHWILHAFSIISINSLDFTNITLYSLLLVPFPTFFYILTSEFTDPGRF